MAINFMNAMHNEETVSTENGALGYKTTGKALSDINFAVPHLRELAIVSNKQDKEIADDELWELFLSAYRENPVYALKWLLFLRDVRGGIGERESFRAILRIMANKNEKQALSLIRNIDIAEFGRFDDLVSILNDVPNEVVEAIICKIIAQINEDRIALDEGKNVSLLAKWLPSANTSSIRSRKLARKIAEKMNIKESEYRKLLSRLRKQIRIVETSLTNKEYASIDYASVPSKAALLYRGAFMRNDEERYSAYLKDVKEGKAEIKADAMFLHDILHAYTEEGAFGSDPNCKDFDETLEAQWSAQKKFDDFKNTIVVRDGSGSMDTPIGGTTATALEVATAIALYCADNNDDCFRNKFITFSDNPKVVDLHDCNTLREKLIRAYREADWMGTDLQKTMRLILNTAVANNVPQDEIPSVLIISDMEFNEGVKHSYRNEDGELEYASDETLMATIAREYSEKGYSVPRIVFWNVNSRSGAIPMRENSAGLILVSGFSRSLIELACSNELDPYKALIKVLDGERYACVTDEIVVR